MKPIFAAWKVRLITANWVNFYLLIFDLVIMRDIRTEIILIVWITALIIYQWPWIKDISTVLIKFPLGGKQSVIFRILFYLFFFVELSQSIWDRGGNYSLLFFNKFDLFELQIGFWSILDHAKPGIFGDALIFQKFR